MYNNYFYKYHVRLYESEKNLKITGGKMFNISVIVNAVAIIAGGILGLLIGKKLSEKIQKMLFTSVALTTIIMGVQMGLKAENFLVVLGALSIGGVAGEVIDIEGRLARLAGRIEKSDGQTKFVKGFVSSTVLFVVGPMTVLGCINAGITNDNSIIYLKSLLDGISSVIFGSVYGFGVIASAASVMIIQGLLVSFAGSLSFLSDEAYLLNFTAVGGVMVLAIGIRLLDIKEIKVGNFLPSLGAVILLDYIKTLIA